MRRLVVLLLAFAVATPVAIAGATFPDVIPLPPGFNPEGIATGNGDTFYVGSIPTGAVVQGSYSTGEADPLVPAQTGRAATGLKFRHGLLWVSGAGTGRGFVYDADTGGNVATLQLADPPASQQAPSFINDVVVTPKGAFFTDSMRPVLYRVDTVRGGGPTGITRLPLTGDYVHQPGFNLNGIDAARNGLLIAVQTASGKLFAINPNTGRTEEIDLGGATLPFGDGILLEGQTLYVVQNQLDQIAVVRLSPGLKTGTVTGVLTDEDLDVPTTIAPFGNSLYAVNARFGRATPTDNHFEVVKVQK
jgi:sugar lactone lactonase YvrE